MKIRIDKSESLVGVSKLGLLAAFVFAPLSLLAPASAAHKPPTYVQPKDAVWSDAAGEITDIGRAAVRDIRRATDGGVARIASLGAKGADMQEISQVGFRTVQFIVLRASDARTDVEARLQDGLDFLDKFGGPLDLRDRIRQAARYALQEIDASVDQAVADVHQAIWITLQES